jgi:broad specificity phosphatase PhoE
MADESARGSSVTPEPDTALSTVTELFMIRHGNAKRLPGKTYVTAPLTKLGRRQAELTGEYLKTQGVRFDGYYCSPLLRAIETANLIGERIGQMPAVGEGIHEMEYRELPATIAAELLARTGMLNRYFETRAGKAIRYPMLGRVANGMMNIFTRHVQGRIGVVVHGGVISSVLSWYLPRERRRWWRDTVGNCSITRVQIQAGRATLVEFDSVAHLGPLAATAHERNYTLSTDEGV